MSEVKKKRPWFQLHLSTLIVLTLVASALVYMNMTPWSHEKFIYSGYFEKGWPFAFLEDWSSFGDPSKIHIERLLLDLLTFVACIGIVAVAMESKKGMFLHVLTIVIVTSVTIVAMPTLYFIHLDQFEFFPWKHFFASNFLVLAMVSFFSELLIRRREARSKGKEGEVDPPPQ